MFLWVYLLECGHTNSFTESSIKTDTIKTTLYNRVPTYFSHGAKSTFPGADYTNGGSMACEPIVCFVFCALLCNSVLKINYNLLKTYNDRQHATSLHTALFYSNLIYYCDYNSSKHRPSRFLILKMPHLDEKLPASYLYMFTLEMLCEF